jgi:hypothetical protein
LFNRPRTELTITHLAEEINVPTALRRRALYDDLQALRAGSAQSGRYFDPQPVLEVIADDVPIPTAGIYVCDLSDVDTGGVIDWRRPPPSVGDARTVAVDPKLGRLSFATGETPSEVEVGYAYGFGDDLGGGPYNRRDSVESWLPRFQKPEVADPDFELWQIGVTQDSSVHAAVGSHSPVVGTLLAAIHAWNNFAATAPNALGIIAVMDNLSYEEDLSAPTAEITIPGSGRLAIVAADWPDNGQIVDGEPQRPRGRIVPQNRRLHLKADLYVRGTATAHGQTGELVLDGVLLEGELTVRPGNLGALHIAHCTAAANAAGLQTGCTVETGGGGGSLDNNANLAISVVRSIVGPLLLPESIAALALQDSIVGEDRSAGGGSGSGGGLTTSVALQASGADTYIARCTLFGTVAVRTVNAENSLFTGVVEVIRRQAGCLRFCYVPPSSRTPRRYRCQPDFTLMQLAEAAGLESLADLPAEQVARAQARVRPDFTSSRYGEAAFAQLSRRCAKEISCGGDDGAEMGVFYGLKQPQREANLRGALEEYLRFGLEAGIFFAT